MLVILNIYFQSFQKINKPKENSLLHFPTSASGPFAWCLLMRGLYLNHN